MKATCNLGLFLGFSSFLESVCFEEARREGRIMRISFSYVSGRVRSLSQEAGNQRLKEPHKINQECQENECSGAEERTKDKCSPQKQRLSLLSSCPLHQLTQLQQTSPMLSSTNCQLKP
jgi:hypothetical protein